VDKKYIPLIGLAVQRAGEYVGEGNFEEAVKMMATVNHLGDPFTKFVTAAVYGVWLTSPMKRFDLKTEIAQKAIGYLDSSIQKWDELGSILAGRNFPFRLEDFYFFRAEANLYLRNNRKALSDIDSAIARRSADATFWSFRGGIYLDQLNDPEEAANSFKTSLYLKEDARVFVFLAWAYIDMVDTNNAIGFMHMAVKRGGMQVLDMERDHDPGKNHQWSVVKSLYRPVR
jgi:tetratricopeptide (TPR) repeat protein